MSNVLMITLFIAETTCNAAAQITFRPLSKPAVDSEYKICRLKIKDLPIILSFEKLYSIIPRYYLMY